MSDRPATPPGSLPASLRSLAENARSGDQKTWWLWDDETRHEYGPMLGFAHAATPEAVLHLLEEADKAVELALWIAALDVVPIERRIEWVAGMRSRFEEIAEMRESFIAHAKESEA